MISGTSYIFYVPQYQVGTGSGDKLHTFLISAIEGVDWLLYDPAAFTLRRASLSPIGSKAR
jgi:hypothetical protein